MKESLYNHSGPVQQRLMLHSSSMALCARPHASNTTATNTQRKGLEVQHFVLLWTPLMSPYVTHSSRKEVTTAVCPIHYTHTTVLSLRMTDIGVCALEWWYPYMCLLLWTSFSQIPRSWGFSVSAVCALVVGGCCALLLFSLPVDILSVCLSCSNGS